MVRIFKRPSADEMGHSIRDAVHRYLTGQVTLDQLGSQLAETDFEISWALTHGRLSMDGFDRILDIVKDIGGPMSFFVCRGLYYSLAKDSSNPDVEYAMTVTGVRGIGSARESAEAAANAGNMEQAAYYLDEPIVDSWVEASPVPNGEWFLTKAQLLWRLGRQDAARSTARKGEETIRAFLRRGGGNSDDLTEYLTDLAGLLAEQRHAMEGGRA